MDCDREYIQIYSCNTEPRLTGSQPPGASVTVTNSEVTNAAEQQLLLQDLHTSLYSVGKITPGFSPRLCI